MFKRNLYTCLLVVAGVLIAGFLYGRQVLASDYISLVSGCSVGDGSGLDIDVCTSLNSTLNVNKIYNEHSFLSKNITQNTTIHSVNKHSQTTITSISILNPRFTDSTTPFGVIAIVSSNNYFTALYGLVRYVAFSKLMNIKFFGFSRFGTISAVSKPPTFHDMPVSGYNPGQIVYVGTLGTQAFNDSTFDSIFSSKMSANKEIWALNGDSEYNAYKKDKS